MPGAKWMKCKDKAKWMLQGKCPQKSAGLLCRSWNGACLQRGSGVVSKTCTCSLFRSWEMQVPTQRDLDLYPSEKKPSTHSTRILCFTPPLLSPLRALHHPFQNHMILGLVCSGQILLWAVFPLPSVVLIGASHFCFIPQTVVTLL